MRRLVLFAVLLSLATPAAAFERQFRLAVTPAGGQDFTVNYRIGARLSDYWCSAGRYARSALGASNRTRLYRVSPPPQRRGESMTFSLDPARSGGDTGFTTFGGPQDGSLSVNQAVAENCHNAHIRQSRGDN